MATEGQLKSVSKQNQVMSKKMKEQNKMLISMSENFQTAMEVMRTQGTDDINLMRQKLNQTDLVLSDITNQTNSIANATNVLYD